MTKTNRNSSPSRHRNSNNRNGSPSRNNNSNNYISSGKFEGSHPQLIGYYYTYNREQQAVDQYQRTTDKLIEIVCSTFKEPQLIKATITDLEDQYPPEPRLQYNGPKEGTAALPTATREDELKYNALLKEWQYTTKCLKESLGKAYTVIHGQCNDAMKAKLTEATNWKRINSSCDTVGLLKILQSVTHKVETQSNATVALIQAEKRLMNMVQGDTQSNDAYRLKFENQASVIQSMGGNSTETQTLTLSSKSYIRKNTQN